MKRSTKTTKPKEVTVNERKPRPVQTRSEAPIVRPSLHPWYYVKGRPDLTEKNISSRRERDEQRHKQSVSDSKYFDKQFAEMEVFHKWEDNKSLVKHPKQVSLRPPYDVFIEPKPKPGLTSRLNKELEKKYSKAKQLLTEFMQKFKALDENYNQLEKRQNILVFQLKELRKIKISAEEKIHLYELKTKSLVHNRFNRDKLRKKVFQIIDLLEDHKISVKKIKLLKNCEGVLTDEELTQLTDVIERGLKIIEMYIELNQNRNKEYQNLYDEEADNRWETQEVEWQTEYQIWNVMTEKLIQSFINVIKEKLSQLLVKESNGLEERQKALKELTEFTAKINSDSQLWVLMSQNIEDFMIEINQNKDNNS